MLVLRAKRERPETITATHALAKRGMSLLKAKRAVEAATGSEAVFEVPTVENLQTLADELGHAGFEVAKIEKKAAFNVRRLRERLRMSQEAFAHRYGLETAAVRNWEQGRRPLEGMALSYLRAIQADPVGTARAQEQKLMALKGLKRFLKERRQRKASLALSRANLRASTGKSSA